MAMSDGLINHFGGVQLRVKGSGDLKMRLLSLDEVKTKTLLALPIQTVTNKELTRISNFTQQRAQLEILTTEIDEYFEISKIIIFTKPVAENYPG